jgi:hypothetical protein
LEKSYVPIGFCERRLESFREAGPDHPAELDVFLMAVGEGCSQ